jgi:N-acylneuraminate cytidylyltransferase
MVDRKEKILAIIPARGGSKRIPRKNIRPFLGKPAISYAIDVAVKTNLFNEVMVSTDDNEIAEVSLALGAKVPFMRSAKNSDDKATLTDVIREVLSEYTRIGKTFNSFCCIYPVTPLLDQKLLINAYSILRDGKFDTVIPIISYSHPIQRALRINHSGKLEMINEEYANTRTQDFQKSYYDAGQFFFMNTKSFLDKWAIFTDNTCGIEVPLLSAQDIDNGEDWRIAEVKYRILHNL